MSTPSSGESKSDTPIAANEAGESDASGAPSSKGLPTHYSSATARVPGCGIVVAGAISTTKIILPG